MSEITRESLIQMGVLEKDAKEFDADAARKEVALRDAASIAALNRYRLEKGLVKQEPGK